MAGTNNVFSSGQGAAGAPTAPGNPNDQTGSLLKGGWNELAQNLTMAYGLSRISGASPVVERDTEVTSPALTPQTRVIGGGGILGSPMMLLAIGGAVLAVVLLMRKR